MFTNQGNKCIYLLLLLMIFLNAKLVRNEETKKVDRETELLDKEYGVRYASECEACKYTSRELEEKFNKLGQTSEEIEIGYRLDEPKKKTKYTRSEMYLIETLENICDRMLEYKIHKERKGSDRFDKDQSTTFKTLHGLVDKGVKVDLGIPHDLWDSPSAEITDLKQKCEQHIENYNEIIEQWYWGERDQNLTTYLCRDRVLKKDQQSCLDETPTSKNRDEL